MNLRPERFAVFAIGVLPAFAAYAADCNKIKDSARETTAPPSSTRSHHPRRAPAPQPAAASATARAQAAGRPATPAASAAARAQTHAAGRPAAPAASAAARAQAHAAGRPAARAAGGRPTRPRSEARIADGAAALATRDDAAPKAAPQTAQQPRDARRAAEPAQPRRRPHLRRPIRSPRIKAPRQQPRRARRRDRVGRSAPAAAAAANPFAKDKSARQEQGGRAGGNADRRHRRCACWRTGSWASGRSGGRAADGKSPAAPASNPFAQDGGQKGGAAGGQAGARETASRRRPPADPAKLAKPQRVRPRGSSNPFAPGSAQTARRREAERGQARGKCRQFIAERPGAGIQAGAQCEDDGACQRFEDAHESQDQDQRQHRQRRAHHGRRKARLEGNLVPRRRTRGAHRADSTRRQPHGRGRGYRDVRRTEVVRPGGVRVVTVGRADMSNVPIGKATSRARTSTAAGPMRMCIAPATTRTTPITPTCRAFTIGLPITAGPSDPGVCRWLMRGRRDPGWATTGLLRACGYLCLSLVLDYGLHDDGRRWPPPMKRKWRPMRRPIRSRRRHGADESASEGHAGRPGAAANRDGPIGRREFRGPGRRTAFLRRSIPGIASSS